MFRTTTAIATVVAFMAAPAAMAGNVDAPAPEPVVAAPAPMAPVTPDWTGFYAGGQVGWADVDPDNFSSDNAVIGGLVAGYDYDLQNGFVVGAGLDYDFTNADFGNNDDLEEIFRAKLRGGYKIGRGLLYATGGYAWADTDDFGSGDGYFVGGGYEHLVTDNVSLGLEALYHDIGSFDDNNSSDADVTTVQARATFRF